MSHFLQLVSSVNQNLWCCRRLYVFVSNVNVVNDSNHRAATTTFQPHLIIYCKRRKPKAVKFHFASIGLFTQLQFHTRIAGNTELMNIYRNAALFLGAASAATAAVITWKPSIQTRSAGVMGQGSSVSANYYGSGVQVTASKVESAAFTSGNSAFWSATASKTSATGCE